MQRINGADRYDYDANGNMTVRNKGLSSQQSLTWTHENRLEQVTGNGINEEYIYDDTGQRIRKSNSSSTVYYPFPHYEVEVGDGSVVASSVNDPALDPAAEPTVDHPVNDPAPSLANELFLPVASNSPGSTADASSGTVRAAAANVTVVVKYYLFNGQRVMMHDGTSTYLHADHLGSTTLLTVNGAQVTNQKYDAFGEKRGGGSMSTDRQYTGQQKDSTGLYYYGARYYDPTLGQFLSPDTIVPDPEEVFDYNRYMYVRGNALKYNDPSGHFVETVWDAANIGIGAVSLAHNVRQGNWTDAAWDAGGLVVDVGATALPFVPGGAAAAIRAGRTANQAVNAVQAAESLSYLRHVDQNSFQTLLSLGKRNWDEFDNIIREAGSNSVIRGITDRAGNQILLKAGNRDAGLRHIIGRHLSGTLPGSVTTFFPEWAKVGDITNAVSDVISNGTRTINEANNNWVYSWNHEQFGEIKVIVDELGEIVSAYPTK